MGYSSEDYRDLQWEQTEDYIKGVKDGSIICNKWIKLAVERFENDVNRKDVSVLTEKVDKVFEFFSILNAEIDGGIGQFNLLPFQSFIITALFGPYWTGTNERKYKEAFLYMARKNGKTTFAAALQAYFLVMNEDTFPESILVAHSRDQANRALDALQRMVMYTPELFELLGFNRRMVYLKPTSSMGFSETVPAKEASLQGYKLTTCILDEIHTYDDNKLYTSAKKGMSNKLNPLLFMISTAGDQDKTFCKDQIIYSQKVLKGEVQDDSFFPMLYMPDIEDLKNWTSENVWHKANPALGIVKRIEFMRNGLNKAKFFPTEKYDFLTYDLNIYTDSVLKWIPEDAMRKVLKAFDDERVKGRKCYIGADFSEVKDLSSIALLFPDEHGETFIAKIIYIFPNEAEKLQRKGNVNLKYWIEQDHITQCQKPVIDDVEILDLIRDANDKYDVDGFGYDTRAGKKIAASIEQLLPVDVIRPIHQGFGLSPAIKAIQVLIETERIEIDNNPVTKWNFDNVLIKPDDFGNWKLDKKKSKEAIDGVVALCNAYKIWEELNYEPDYMASISQLEYERNKR